MCSISGHDDSMQSVRRWLRKAAAWRLSNTLWVVNLCSNVNSLRLCVFLNFYSSYLSGNRVLRETNVWKNDLSFCVALVKSENRFSPFNLFPEYYTSHSAIWTAIRTSFIRSFDSINVYLTNLPFQEVWNWIPRASHRTTHFSRNTTIRK